MDETARPVLKLRAVKYFSNFWSKFYLKRKFWTYLVRNYYGKVWNLTNAIQSNRVLFRIFSNRILLKVLSKRVLLRVLSNRFLLRISSGLSLGSLAIFFRYVCRKLSTYLPFEKNNKAVSQSFPLFNC